jgi:hypothetical protein
MTGTTARAATVATLTLTAALAVTPLLCSAAAAAEGGNSATRSKAAIEHDERVAAAAPSTKAQIEHDEMTVRDTGTSGSEQSDRITNGQTPATGGDAAAWQLAVSAALGAAVTGAAFVGARQVAHHRTSAQPVAP